MFDFMKKDKDIDIDNINTDEECLEDIDYQKEILQQLEYLNSYIATSNMIYGELTKQLTISNALNMLNQQYQQPDRFMDIVEIQSKYKDLAPEIFQDYAILREKELNNLEKNK